MTQQELQQRLNQPYSTDNWKQVVTEVFPNVQLFDPVLTIPVENSKVESFRQLGNVRLQDGKSLALFELKLKGNVNILRNRVELNNLVSQYIDQEQNHGVLSIFEQGGEDYRFTFSAKATTYEEEEADFVTKKTDTKRFTYLLGKNESCKTPAMRLHDLSTKKAEADIHTIQEAFSVEKLSTEFFEEYKVHYTRMVNYLIETSNYRTEIFNGEDKSIRDFVKLTLGRLVFIQFLQKKRWMGVPATAAGWDSGDPHFLKHSFQNYVVKDLYYSHFLEPLFYEALNLDGRPNQVFAPTGTKVPYLNGGLFEKGKENTYLINFPPALFEELFAFFDRYNFTIDESDPKEQEVGIDPEMLGHIFENLLEDNKDKGAFYTPKEIVHYMCQESLLEYLRTFLEVAGKWPTSDAEHWQLEENLSNFIKKKDGIGIIDYARELAIALRDVKICDPAIGSGAFPMGLLTEIFQAIYLLFQANPAVVGQEWGMEDWKPNVVKKNIIQNSIYGVDIEKGAVDIARLRFWLSLVVDEPEPEALPNLDYKIVIGNSLVPKLGDEVVHIEWNLDYGKQKQQGLSSEDVQFLKSHFEELTNYQKKFFQETSAKKEKLKQSINRSKIELIVFHLELQLKRLENKAGNFSLFGVSEREAKEKAENAIKIKSLKNTILDLNNEKTNPNKDLDFFDWKLNFPEIFNEQVNTKPGFDIVIANPPYIKEYTNRNAFDGFRNSPYYKGKMDIWYGFACIMLDLLKSNGVQCFIAQNNWITSAGASVFRDKVLSESEIKLFTDFGNYKVFETAGIQTMIYNLKKKTPDKTYTLKYNLLLNDNIEKKDLFYFLNSKFKDNNSDKFLFDFESSKFIGKSININKVTNSEILNKIENSANFKLQKKEVIQGIVGAPDEAFILGNNEIGDFNQAELSYLKPYHTNTERISNSHIIYISEKNFKGKSLSDFPNLQSHFEKFKQELIRAKIKYKTPNKPYFYLHRERDESFFIKGEKIICQIRSPKPAFLFTEEAFYVSRAANIIKSSRINLKYLSLIFNSQLTFFYYKHRGASQGNILKFDKGPLLTIPIKLPNKTNKFIFLFNELNKEAPGTKKYKKILIEIDYLIFKLYGLNYKDVKIICPEFALSEEEYNAISLD